MKQTPLYDHPTSENLVLNARILHSDFDIWDSDGWKLRQVEFLKRSLNGEAPRYSILPSLFPSNSPTYSVVDFGGGSGWLFHNLTNSQFPLNNYLLVETSNLHLACPGNHEKYSYEPINIHLTPKYIYPRLILYFNSVIQYFASDLEVIKAVNRFTPSDVIFDDVTPSTGSEFFSQQKYYGQYLAVRFCDVSKLTELLRSVGYELVSTHLYKKVFGGAFTNEFEKNETDYAIGETISLHYRLKLSS
jgi:putative methyltransferase (TIGR04325 family)